MSPATATSTWHDAVPGGVGPDHVATGVAKSPVLEQLHLLCRAGRAAEERRPVLLDLRRRRSVHRLAGALDAGRRPTAPPRQQPTARAPPPPPWSQDICSRSACARCAANYS